MHNCKRTKNALIDLACGEIADAQARELMAELNDCATCHAEHAAITKALRASSQALQSAAPTEEFWQGYHRRLEATLHNAHKDRLSDVEHTPISSRFRGALSAITRSSVPVPVPAALAVLVLFSVLSFALLSRGQSNVARPVPRVIVETRTVQVPVIQEKVITQVVYVEKKIRRNRTVGSQDYANPNTANVAASRSVANGKKPFSLVGFKPTEQVNLTIIKGNDEK